MPMFIVFFLGLLPLMMVVVLGVLVLLAGADLLGLMPHDDGNHPLATGTPD